jgi:hypothetical protein
MIKLAKSHKEQFIVTIILLPNFTIAQNKPTPPKPEPKVKPIVGLNAKFIVALISDGEGGT